jgi:oligoribonuclease
MAMPQDESNLIWIDLEMTGLDPAVDRIIEIATLVTPVLAIHQSESLLAAMDDWNRQHHGASGLVERVRASGWDEAAAEQATLEFLVQWVSPGKSPMCGNSICQDRRFLARLMPRLEAFFHYRNLDVSTLKELARRWAPQVAKSFVKTGRHLALEDVRESIGELRHYREHFLRLP